MFNCICRFLVGAFWSFSLVSQVSGVANTYGIKPAGKGCEGLMGYDNALTTIGNSISIKDGKVLLSFHNIDYIKAIFKDSTDGIAIDLLTDSQFNCGNENQLIASPISKGILLQPLYSDALMKANTAKNKVRFIAEVATIPDDMKDKHIVPAMIVIKKGMACHWSSPVEIPHRTFAPIPFVLTTTHEPEVQLREEGIISSQQIFFQFKRNLTETTQHDHLPTPGNKKVFAVEITSYSSIEGDSAKNEVLHTQRAEFMKREILKLNPTTTVSVRAMENWEKCIFQLEKLGMESLTKKGHKSIRDALLHDHNNNWDSLYFAQRRSHATIYYQGKIARSDTPRFLTMNLQTALFEKNIPLANRALDSLYRSRLSCSALLDENTMTQLLEYPSLVANVCAVLSLSANFQSEEMIRYVRHWLMYEGSLDELARQNLIYLYARTCHSLLRKWDVAATQMARVLHPSRAEKVIVPIASACPSVILLDYNIGTIEYFAQTNEYASIKPKFEAIASYFRKQSPTMTEMEQLVLFYNHWGRFDLTVPLLYQQIDRPDFTKENAFILALTASAGKTRLPKGINYMKIMRTAHQKDKLTYCKWSKENFHLFSDPAIKAFYCKNCNED